jgi:4-hydroxy-3-methylbut-2-en-1-yl diphosphate synthase IspG/GcpE
MIVTPRELLETSIAQLRMLTAFLGDQLADSAVEPRASDREEILACREILVSIGALIVKAQATSGPTFGRVRSEQVCPGEKWNTAHPNRSVRGVSAATTE